MPTNNDGRWHREPEGPGIMFGFFNQSRNCSRRSAIRENRHDYEARSATELPRHDLVPSLAIAGVFWIAITCLLLLRKEVVQYRPGEYVPHDIVARVDFRFTDRALYDNLAKEKRESAPRVYRRIAADPWDKIQDYLLALPDTVQDRAPQELDAPLRDILDSGSITELEQDRTGAARQIYESDVRQFVAYARKHLVADDAVLAIINQSDRDQENILAQRFPEEVRHVDPSPPAPSPDQQTPQTAAGEQPKELYLDIADVYGTNLPESFDAPPRRIRARLRSWPGAENRPHHLRRAGRQSQLSVRRPGHAGAAESGRKHRFPQRRRRGFRPRFKIVSGSTTLSDRDFDLLNRRTTPITLRWRPM